MSVKAIGWVWDNSQSEGAARLVLLAIADCANASGGDAWPSVAELCRKTRLSERGVQKAIRKLTEVGELRVMRNTGRGRTNRYRIVMETPHPVRGSEAGNPEQGSPEPGAPPNTVRPQTPNSVRKTPNRVHPEPSRTVTTEPSLEGSLDRSSSGSRRASEDDDPTIDQTITETLHAATGRTITPEWAARVRRQILAGRKPADPRAYVAAAIRGEPRRFLPTNGDPSSRSLTEALAAARGEL